MDTIKKVFCKMLKFNYFMELRVKYLLATNQLPATGYIMRSFEVFFFQFYSQNKEAGVISFHLRLCLLQISQNSALYSLWPATGSCPTLATLP